MLHNELIAIDKRIEFYLDQGYSLSQTITEATQWRDSQNLELTDNDVVGQVEILWDKNKSIPALGFEKTSNDERFPVPFNGLNPPSLSGRAIPGIMGEYARALARSIQVPFELAFANVLGAFAIAGQRKFKIQVCDGYTEPLSIYALCALPPGERKSSTVENCKRPLVEWQKTKQKEVAEKRKKLSSDKLTIEAAIKHARVKAARAKTVELRREEMERIKTLEAEIPDIPALPRLLADDFTPEALGVMMGEHDQRIGVLEAEGGLFDTLSGRYSSGVPNLDAVLKFWSGEAAQIDRQGRDSICLDDPHLTLVISPQPEVVQGLASKPGFRGRGLIGRFLYFLPISKLGFRDAESRPIPEELKQRYAYKIRDLLAIPWARNGNGAKTSHIIRLSSEALLLWKNMFASVEDDLQVGGGYEHMRDWAGKFPGQLIRLAGLLHISMHETPQNHEVSAKTMETAICIGDVLSEHAKAVFSLMGTDKSQECAQAILEWIRRDRVSTFTARDALNKVRGRYPTMSEITPALKELEERSYIFAINSPNRSAGRPKSQEYVVNNLAYERRQ